MIFVILGSQKFQFNRLLKAIDQLKAENKISDLVFAQAGYSDYLPQHYEFKNFLDREEFNEMIERADIVITHGGTGAIIGAVKKGKKVIAVPRLAEFAEHVDDHQLQIITQFEEMNLISSCRDCNKLDQALSKLEKEQFKIYESNTKTIIDSIDLFISSSLIN